MNKFYKQAIGLFCGIVICSSIFVGLFSLYKQDLIEKDHLLTSLNDISLKNKELNKIGIKNRLSLSDKNGMKIDSEEDMDGVQDIFDFDVASNYDEDVYFEIYLSEYLFNNLDSKYIKIYLENRETGEAINLVKGLVPTYYDLLVSSSNSNAKRLYYGLIKGKEIKKYRLRVWLSDSYPLNADETEYFNMKLHVKVN